MPQIHLPRHKMIDFYVLFHWWASKHASNYEALHSLPFPGVSLQFQGGTPLAATASAVVMARGCPSWSKLLSRLSVGLPVAICQVFENYGKHEVAKYYYGKNEWANIKMRSNVYI